MSADHERAQEFEIARQPNRLVLIGVIVLGVALVVSLFLPMLGDDASSGETVTPTTLTTAPSVTGDADGTNGTGQRPIDTTTFSSGARVAASGYRLLGGRATYDGQLYFLPATQDGESYVPEVTSIVEGEALSRSLGERLSIGRGFDARAAQPGEHRDNLLTTEVGLVALVNGEVRLLDQRLEREPIDLGPGLSAMTSADGRHLWIFGSAERMVRRVDLSDLSVGPEHPIAELGRPVAPFGGGLLLTTRGRREPGNFALWTEDDPLVELEGTADMDYVGASAERLVLGRGDRLVLFHRTAMDSRTMLPRPESIGTSALSPDGRLLAYSVITPLTEPNRIEVLDLSNGEVIDRIEPSLEIGYRWSGDSTVLYMEPQWPSFTLVERNVAQRTDLDLIFFLDLSWRYTGGR